MKSATLIIAACLTLGGCANNVYSTSYSPITREYSKQLDQVNLGMTKSQLRQIFPDMTIGGQNSVGGQQIEAMELRHNYWSGIGGHTIKDELWFYLNAGKLVKWGRPNDWPTPADLVIQVRQ